MKGITLQKNKTAFRGKKCGLYKLKKRVYWCYYPRAIWTYIHSDADKGKMDIFIPKQQQTEAQLTQYTITIT